MWSVFLSLFFSLCQISVWEQNLECYNVDLFRLRCYLCSLQGEELPNPKPLLSVASRSTKLSMGRLGFSVSSFHALVINTPPLNDLSVSASLPSLHPLNSPWASPSPLSILWWPSLDLHLNLSSVHVYLILISLYSSYHFLYLYFIM